MGNQNEQCAIGFITNIWNEKRYEMVGEYLHPDFMDHSLPNCSQNRYGLILYLKALDKKILHETIIEDLACETDMVMIRFTMRFCPKHGSNHEAKTASGYRYLRMSRHKIIDHWEILKKDI